MMPYNLSALRSNLTRAVNRGDEYAIARACEKARLTFNFHGFPDDWSTWTRALDDAIWKLRHEGAINDYRITSLVAQRNLWD